MKKVIIPIVIAILIILIACSGKIVRWLFAQQYNSKGISHFLVITLDNEQQKEYVGELEEHDVYIEGLNIAETNFRTINAENLSIKDAIESNLVSIEDWKNYALRITEEESGEILKFENYEILVTTGECVIRPLT